MAQPDVQLAVVDRACPRCSHPEDLLPIQQAVVVRSFPRRFAASFVAASPALPPFTQASSGVVAATEWPPLEHVTYVSAMFAAASVHLSEMLGQECLGVAHPVSGAPRPCGDLDLEAVLARLDDQAERLGRTIMRGAAIRDWHASRDGPSAHGLVHRAIDEATEHLQALEGRTLHEAHLSYVGPGPPPRFMA